MKVGDLVIINQVANQGWVSKDQQLGIIVKSYIHPHAGIKLGKWFEVISEGELIKIREDYLEKR
tara:strand:+ start:481 stop:672 length:192 start_codon:yes stop_codon:yes gene_type:complete